MGWTFKSGAVQGVSLHFGAELHVDTKNIYEAELPRKKMHTCGEEDVPLDSAPVPKTGACQLHRVAAAGCRRPRAADNNKHITIRVL